MDEGATGMVDDRPAVPTDVAATEGGTETMEAGGAEVEEETAPNPSAVELPSSPTSSSSNSVSVRSKGAEILGAASKKLKGSMPVSFLKNVMRSVNNSRQLTPARAMVMCWSTSSQREATLASSSPAKQNKRND